MLINGLCTFSFVNSVVLSCVHRFPLAVVALEKEHCNISDFPLSVFVQMSVSLVAVIQNRDSLLSGVTAVYRLISLLFGPTEYFVKSTSNYQSPHYIIFSNLLLLPFAWVQKKLAK